MNERPAADRRALSAWLGLAGFYTASFAALGVYMQFFPTWLHDVQGFDEAQVAVVLSAQTISRTLFGPWWSQQVDRSGDARRVLLGLAVGGALSFALFPVAPTLALAWGCAFLFGATYPPMHPIVDSAAVRVGARHGFSFGRLRMVGSVSFLLVIVLVGALLERTGTGAVFPILAVALAVTAVAAWFVPRHSHAHDGERPRASWWQPLASRPFVVLLVATALIQGSHATYYNLSTVHWKAKGLGEQTAALLWAEGVFAEIVLLFVGRQLLERWRPTTLLIVGGLAAIVRWGVVASTTALPWLYATAWLHALTFAATYLGAIGALERRVPPHLRATAQGLLGAATSGLGMVICGLCGGYVYRRAGPVAWWWMAAFAALGVALAVWLRRGQSAQGSATSATAISPE